MNGNKGMKREKLMMKKNTSAKVAADVPEW